MRPTSRRRGDCDPPRFVISRRISNHQAFLPRHLAFIFFLSQYSKLVLIHQAHTNPVHPSPWPHPVRTLVHHQKTLATTSPEMPRTDKQAPSKPFTNTFRFLASDSSPEVFQTATTSRSTHSRPKSPMPTAGSPPPTTQSTDLGETRRSRLPRKSNGQRRKAASLYLTTRKSQTP